MTDNLDTKIYAYISSAWVRLLDIENISMNWGPKGSRVSDADELIFVLNNTDGRYTPDGPSALAGWDEGLLVMLVEAYTNTTNVRFIGRIAKIKIPSAVKDIRVTVTVLGWMDNAMKTPVVNPPLLTDSTIDDGFTELLSYMAVQPQATDITTGTFTFDRLFDDTREKTTVFTEINKFINSEIGRAYITHRPPNGETLVVENFETRNGTNAIAQIPAGFQILLDDSGNVLLDDSGNVLITAIDFEMEDCPVFTAIQDKEVQRGEDVINYYNDSAYPKKIDTKPVLLYESAEDIYLAAGESKTDRIFWTDSSGNRKINAIPPTGAGGVVALCHFNLENVVGGGLDGAGLGVGGYFLDETGKELIDNDAPYINFSKFGNGSAYFDGSNAWLEYSDSPDWDFGSGDFTIKVWVYTYATTADWVVVSRDASKAFPPFVIKSNGTNYTISLSSAGVSFDIASGVSMGSIVANEWHLYEATRSSGTLYTFKDGTLVTSVAAAGTIQASSANLFLGKNHLGTWFGGNMDDFFVTKGRPLHTATYTADAEEAYMLDGLYYEANTSSAYTGTNVKDQVTYTVTYGTEGATITRENTSTTGMWIREKIYGYGIYSNTASEHNVKDQPSINIRGEKPFSLSQPYQVNTALGELEAKRVVELWRNPRTVLKSISFIPNATDQLMRSYLYLDIGDLIPVQITADGIDAHYYIDGISTQKAPGGNVSVKYDLLQAWTLAKGLSHVAVEFAGGAALDRLDFGYLPLVSADEVTDRVFSAWVYLDAVTNANDQVIIGTKGSGRGVSFFVDNHATDVILAFDSYTSSSIGRWTVTNPFTVGSWNHVLVRYNSSSIANDPVMYVNGSLQTLTEAVTPTGVIESEEGAALVIGNNKVGVKSWNGKLKDLRVYDMSKTSRSTATLAAGLYGEGAGGSGYYEGMKFVAFTVRTDELTAFTDLTLTTEKLLDGYLGMVGTPSGSPIVRTV